MANNIYGIPDAGPAIYVETDFVEKGREILARARRAATLSIHSFYVRAVIREIEALLDEAFLITTPVGKDYKDHLAGELKRSTVSRVVEILGEDGAQWAISVEQAAESPKGVQYMPFVVLGHDMPHGGHVVANPYPTRTLETIREEINIQLELLARHVAMDTVMTVTYGDSA